MRVLLFLLLLSRETIETRLERAKPGNVERHAELVRLFRASGCRVTEQRIPNAALPNVLCTIPGTSDRTIYVTAHYDMIGPGLGVADNWGSASLLPSLYETFAATKPRHTIVFIGFGEEEKGLIGAKHFVASASREQLASIDALINIDGAGMASMRVWHTKSDPKLVRRLKTIARELKVDVTESSLDGAGIMDSFPFHARGVPVLSLHGLAPGNYHVPHSVHDDLDAVDVRHLYDAYRVVVKLVDELKTGQSRS